MAQPRQPAESTLVDWYEGQIGEPTTRDEAYGYLLFIAGVIAGIVGMVLFFTSEPNLQPSSVKQVAIALTAVGLALLIAGPIIRLPLQQRATQLTYVGMAVSLLAVLWFLIAYPVNPITDPATANPIIGLYGLGLGVMAISGIFVPVLTEPSAERARTEARIADLESEVERQREEIESEKAATEQAEADRAEAERDLEAQRADAESEATAREEAERERDEERAEADALAARIEELETSNAQFELYEDRGGAWRWRLRHRNGNVIATGGEGYASKQKAQQGLASVRRNALGAAVVQLAASGTEDTDEDETDAEDPAVPEPDSLVDAESRAEFELYEDNAGEYRWRLVHENGNIIADGGEGYASKQKARQGMDSVRRNVQQADYLRIDPTAYEVYRDRGGDWRWRLIHENGNVLADGGQGYSSRAGARNGIESVKENAGDAAIEEVDE